MGAARSDVKAATRRGARDYRRHRCHDLQPGPGTPSIGRQHARPFAVPSRSTIGTMPGRLPPWL